MIPIKNPQPRNPRYGFTMIELLIVITILLLLTTFTVVAIDFTFESERVSAGARQVQSMLSGARDRAIRAREARGLRFFVDQDPDNGRMVSSVAYVGAAKPWSLGTITLKRPDFNNDGTVDDLDGDGAPDDTVLMVDGSDGVFWSSLKRRGFLGIYEFDANGDGVVDPAEDLNGNGAFDQDTPRIKIPGDKNGTWYRIRTDRIGVDSNYPNRIQLLNAYRDPGTTSPDEVIAFEGTGPSTYILELPPRILPDAEPVLLPDGVVIDLDASEVPAHWRPGAGAGYAVSYSNRMDLMFTPRGTVDGASAGTGLLHFYVALRQDVQNAMHPSVNRPTVNESASPRVPTGDIFDPVDDIAGNGSPGIGDRSLVTVVTSTGKVASHPIDITDNFINGSTTNTPDNYADDPFVFAELGEVKN